MLSITTKSPYALRALAELGRSGEGPVPIGELARRREIPVQFLEQLFAVLRRAGVLRSQRGVKGGYSFARPPHEITVLEVVELLDGPLGREAKGIFADAATAAREVLAGRDHRRRHRARGARGRRGDVLHLEHRAEARSGRFPTITRGHARGPRRAGTSCKRLPGALRSTPWQRVLGPDAPTTSNHWRSAPSSASSGGPVQRGVCARATGAIAPTHAAMDPGIRTGASATVSPEDEAFTRGAAASPGCGRRRCA